jgi:hypothetical protein
MSFFHHQAMIKDPSVLEDLTTDSDFLAADWLRTHNRVNLYDTCQQIFDLVINLLTKSKLFHFYSCIRHGLKLLVFQPDESDTRSIGPDELAFQLDHHVCGFVLALKMKCFQCKKDVPSGLLKCKGCNIAHYCSKECQRENWKAHKKMCKLVQNDIQTNNRTPTERDDKMKVIPPKTGNQIFHFHLFVPYT